MIYTSKGQFAFYMAFIFIIYFQSDIAYAQDINSSQKVTELKSLKINHQVNLNHILKPTVKLVEKKPKTDIANASEQPISMQLVGTMILGQRRLAWIKVEDQVYQLESGQSIPGLKRLISQINPESVVLIYAQPCDNVDSCDSSLTLTIRDALF